MRAAGRVGDHHGGGAQFVVGVLWVTAAGGFYGVQNIGTTLAAVNVPVNTSATLYRITAVAVVGNNQRSVVESIYAKY